MTALVALVLALVAAAGWLAVRRGWLRLPVRVETDAAAPAAPVPPPDELLRGLQTAEVRALYAALGYDPEVEARVAGLLQTLRSSIRTDVPDPAALRQALARAPVESVAVGGDGDAPPLALLQAVRTAGTDDAVLALLNRDPMEDVLPFAEVLPVRQDGRVVWRPVQEVTLVRKAPADPHRFRRDLDALERLVRTAPLQRTPRAQADVLEALERVRAGLARAQANLPLALRELEKQVERWLHRAHLGEPYARKQALDGLLHDAALLRHALASHPARPLDAGALASLRAAARRNAQGYLAASWMHHPALTALLLTDLLDTELAAFAPKQAARPTTAAGVLRLVRDEAASGCYDPSELVRRLHHLEAAGLYVHSLAHALLRL